ncbi:hypothetical protein GCM10010289_83320 [Streptomyces violascens]|uniref:Transposase IS701-like DDE domain-containing protein n=1 Tax=Streptomyces violascens TaxID=67381 RepID=A0ABQ3QSW2_9ACTN|nr:hypothetical protein GCM10010289_83320 [Streptomyces violascens]GHI40360.1 hypothetical protein Sviol_47680 [Streptomyces violascens]
MGRWHFGDSDILIVFGAGYAAPRMAHLLDGLPIEVLGRMCSDRVMRRPTPSLKEYALAYPQGGRPPKHGEEFRFAGDLGRPGRGHGASHRPVRHRPRDGLGPHPAPPDHPLCLDRPHRRTPPSSKAH